MRHLAALCAIVPGVVPGNPYLVWVRYTSSNMACTGVRSSIWRALDSGGPVVCNAGPEVGLGSLMLGFLAGVVVASYGRAQGLGGNAEPGRKPLNGQLGRGPAAVQELVPVAARDADTAHQLGHGDAHALLRDVQDRAQLAGG